MKLSFNISRKVVYACLAIEFGLTILDYHAWMYTMEQAKSSKELLKEGNSIENTGSSVIQLEMR